MPASQSRAMSARQPVSAPPAPAQPYAFVASCPHSHLRSSSFLNSPSISAPPARLICHSVPHRRRPSPPVLSARAPSSSAPIPLAQSPAAQTDHPLGPPDQSVRIAPRYWTQGIRDDLARRLPLYASDWIDGLRFKSVPVILFMYFACLAPVVAFGGLTSALTNGSIGVIEFLLSSGASGMVYAMFSAQPLTFIAPTGLTLAFTTALYGFCRVVALPFLPTYAWVGLWTSLALCVASIVNASDLIKYCTRFTDDIFNSLIATNFLYEASRSLILPFFLAGADKTNPFTAAALAISTFLLGRFLAGLRNSRYLVARARNLLSDFGPVLAIVTVSAVAAIPAVAKVGLETLSIPSNFSLAGGRAFLIPIMAVPASVRVAAIVPALLLTCLFFLDQNISVRVVNSPVHRLKKGPGYHLDMMVLAVCTFVCSLLGLPWMCAGTVQSLAHVRALADTRGKNGGEYITSVQENRLTAFFVHGGILCSLLLLPVVSRVPMAVISGLFLFLGVKMMGGNAFLARIPYLAMDPKLYPEQSPMRKTGAGEVHAFTMLQAGCLAVLWGLKLNKRTSMLFPAVIALLMVVRSFVAPRLFSQSALEALDGEVFETDAEAEAEAEAGAGAEQ